MSLDIWLKFEVDTGNKPYEAMVYEANITNNLGGMWSMAGIWEALYESQDKHASDILPTLKTGLADMEAKPDEYKLLNPANGWGNYEGALRFLRNLIAACEEYPKAIIGISA